MGIFDKILKMGTQHDDIEEKVIDLPIRLLDIWCYPTNQ